MSVSNNFAETVHFELLPGYAGPKDLTPAHSTDAGIDLFARETVTLAPGERRLVGTGVKLALPEGYEAQIRPTSGNSLKRGLTVLNSPGTIDAGYRGEVGVILYNANPVATPHELMDLTADLGPRNRRLKEFREAVRHRTILIPEGAKIAQMVISRYERPSFAWVPNITQFGSERGTAGFGSTGTV